MIKTELSAEVKDKYIRQLYECFSTGRDFELFLNYFLDKLGFEEVVTTKYVGDKGIDLTCVKKGIDVHGIDTINYYVQAKRYAPSNKVSASEVRDLKGTKKYDKNGNLLKSNFVNILITTSDFTKGAREEAEDDNISTILVNGEQLLQLCIDNEIGFVFTPTFIKEEITKLLEPATPKTASPTSANSANLVSRTITANDVRARILPIPQIILNTIDADIQAVALAINGKALTLNIDKGRRYFGGVTEIYRQCGLINSENVYIAKNANWNIVDGKITITIK